MPDGNAPLDVARVRAALAGTRFADVRYVAETASTNEDAAPLLGCTGDAGATLVAEFQRAGRGRKSGRTWIAPPGSALLFTAILPVAVPAQALWAVPFWSALAAADGVEAACGISLGLRWPNDLDIGERKAGGILCISRVAGASAHVGCGIGINVHRPAGEAEIVPPPAYLDDDVPQVERETVLAAILGAMDALLDVLAAPADVAGAWEDRAGLRGRRYRLRLDADGSVVEGTATGLDAEGGLVIDAGGADRVIHLGDARVI